MQNKVTGRLMVTSCYGMVLKICYVSEFDIYLQTHKGRIMARLHCREGGHWDWKQEQECNLHNRRKWVRCPIPVSVQCKQYSVIYSNPLFPFTLPHPYLVSCSVNEP